MRHAACGPKLGGGAGKLDKHNLASRLKEAVLRLMTRPCPKRHLGFSAG
jgi:hypothetical protein